MRILAEQPTTDENCEKTTMVQLDAVETLSKEFEKEQVKSRSYLNRLTYLQADFENYKKRVKKEIDESLHYGNRRLILELLPVLDELECAVKVGKKSVDQAFLKGVEMTLQKFLAILKKEGLSEIETIGKPFDTNRHEAVNRISVKGKDGIVIEEVRKGFMLRDMIMRPSLVMVGVDALKKGGKR